MPSSADWGPRRPTAADRTGSGQLIEDAYAFLTARLALDRDRHYVFSADNQAVVMFDSDVAERNGELFLTSVDVSSPGRGFGSRIIETLRAFADASNTDLYVGPCTNARYWKATDGTHPDRHPWLSYCGDERGEPVYRYQPQAREPHPGRTMRAASRPRRSTHGRKTVADTDNSYSDPEIRALLQLSPESDRENMRQGRACLHCGGMFAAMIPVGTYRGVQVFAHQSCATRWKKDRHDS